MEDQEKLDELYLPWSCDKDGNIFTSAKLDLLREVGQVHPPFASIIVEQMNKLEKENG